MTLRHGAPALAAGALLLLALLVPHSRLEVVDEAGDPLLVADAMTLRYRHSVARTMVEEDLAPSASGVRLVATRFSSFGAGLPSSPEWGGELAALRGGREADEGLAVTGMKGVLAEVRIRVGPTSEQSVVADGRSLRLDRLVRVGDVVVVRSAILPWIARWLPR